MGSTVLLPANGDRRKLERREGIEPSSSVWKTEAVAKTTNDANWCPAVESNDVQRFFKPPL
jgi:hypothetical protein